MRSKYVILLAAAMLLTAAVWAQDLPTAGTPTAVAPTMGQSPEQGPLSVQDVVLALKKKGQAEQLKKDIGTRGVSFEVDEDTEKQLRKAKASDEMIAAIKAAGPKARAGKAKAAAIANGMSVVPPEEAAEFKALETELDPDKAIALAESYAKKYPQSEVLSFAYAFEANAYENKGDAPHTVDFAEKSLSLKSDNLMALLMICYALPQPQYIKVHQADEEKQLEKAEAYCSDAEKAINALKKRSDESDADFADRKAGYNSSLHADKGMIHLDRAQLGLMSVDTDELAKSVKEYNEAVSFARPQPTDYFRLGEANDMLGKTDDAIAAFTKASELGQGVLKQYADAKIAKLKASKGAAK